MLRGVRRTVAVAVTAGVAVAGLGIDGGAGAAEPVVSLPERTDVPPDSWLGTVNHYRGASGLSPVSERADWSDGIRLHLRYLELTPAGYRTGTYTSDHTENPASPYYTDAGDAAARASNLGGGDTPRGAVELWMTGPFHAIGILRPTLAHTAFAHAQSGRAGLDVLRGQSDGEAGEPVLFPGPGSVNFLDRFLGESPDPREPCGPGFWGLPLIALLPAPPPPGTSATLATPSGRTLTPGAELCVVTADTFHSSDPVYGDVGRTILRDANAVLLIPRDHLVSGGYEVTVRAASTVSWSFTQVGAFDDVADGDRALGPVRWLAANGVTEGIRPGVFGSSGTVTRAQMAAFLHRFAGAPEPTEPLAYHDVPPDAYYADAVRWLHEEGITEGVTADEFGPGRGVNRAQMAAFLHRLAGAPEPTEPLAYHDVPPDAYYADAVRWLDEEGITEGVTATEYGRLRTVARRQMAAFLYRLDGALRA